MNQYTKVKFEEGCIILPNGRKFAAESTGCVIYKTRDYKAFSIVQKNRLINASHVNKLKSSIEKHNLLRANPITVNQWGEVIDGQHRLTAAEQLGEYIYFYIAYDVNQQAIHIINKLRKNWDSNSYLQSHIQGIPSGKAHSTAYTVVNQISKAYNCSVAIALSMLCIQTKGPNKDDFINGNLAIPNDETIKTANRVGQVMLAMDELKMARTISRSRSMVSAIVILVKHSSYEKNVFLKRLETNSARIQRAASVNDYLPMLVKVYNARNTKPLIF